MDQLDLSITSSWGSDTPTQTAKHRNRPPHLTPDNSIFAVPEFIVMDLKPIDGPLDDLEITSALNIDLAYLNNVPWLFAPQHCQQDEAKARILGALNLGYEFLKRKGLKKVVDFTRSDLTKPKLVDILWDLEHLMGCVQVAHNATDIVAVHSDATYLRSIPKNLTNNPKYWWSDNNFKILAACYCHKVKLYLKTITHYLPKPKKVKEEDTCTFKMPVLSQPTTSSASEVVQPQKLKRYPW
jgi:hypothetical protein